MNTDNDVNLYKLKLPRDLKKLSFEQCTALCSQIRKILITTVSKNGGHLASNLGTVELTVAIHRVFNSPKDKIVWDVSHQAYTHKLLTGRADRFDTLRQKDGISGFCRPAESIHDAFVSGHSSTAVSAALGMASAMRIKGDRKHYAVAVVGDGAATGGMTFEGLNNAGKSDTNTIVIMNHNEMSISKNVGGLAKYLSTLRTKDGYIKTKGAVEKLLTRTPLFGKPIYKTLRYSKNALKSVILHSTMFEDLGFEYIGPIDGHNIRELESGLRAAKALKKPVFVHVNTTKGKGYAPAEANPGEFHGIGTFEIETGNPDIVAADSFSVEFGSEICRLARDNSSICAVTAAMKYGTGLQYFAKEFPNRFFDVGIAEEHAVTFCGGLASMGVIPVFAVYSTFLQRAYDQLIHDMAIDGIHAVIGVDRAGAVAGDGETHQGIFDVSFLSTIPGIKIYSPSGYEELRLCVDKAVCEDSGIVAVRYPRGESSDEAEVSCSTDYVLDEHGGEILIVSYGRIISNVYEATRILSENNIVCDVLKMVNIFPITDTVVDIISRYKKVFMFEESYFEGSISQKLMSMNNSIDATAITGFLTNSDIDSLLDECGLSTDKIVTHITEKLNENQA